MSSILKKISIKTAVEVMDFKKLEETTPVLRLAGVVRKAVPGEHAQYGRFYKFMGNFVALDLRTGRESISAVAFLPAPVDELLFQAIEEKDGEGDIEFAFDISVKPRADLAVGYEYLVNNLQETKRSNPLENLMKSLPAPKIGRHDLLENPDVDDNGEPVEPAHKKAKKA